MHCTISLKIDLHASAQLLQYIYAYSTEKYSYMDKSILVY